MPHAMNTESPSLCVWFTHVSVWALGCIWKEESNLWESVWSIYCAVSGAPTQAQGQTSSPNLVLYYFNSGWSFWFCKGILVFLHLNLKCPNTQSNRGSLQDKDTFCFAKQQAIEGYLVNGPFALLKRLSCGKL